MAGFHSMDTVLDDLLRLLAATVMGMIIGLNRDLNGKPTGMRTLGLVALSSAMITISATQFPLFVDKPDALSRVIQGVIQGVLAGVGFLGAGVIMRDTEKGEVHGLTTAATVWVTAAIGIVCGLGQWAIALTAGAITIILLFLGGPFERLFDPSRHNLDKSTSRSGKPDDLSEKTANRADD